MAINILMPIVFPDMEEGAIVTWFKNEGDSIKEGDVIAEIETDKAMVELEATDAGILGKIVVPAGSGLIPVETPIAILLEQGEDPAVLKEVNESAIAPAETNSSNTEAKNNLATTREEAVTTSNDAVRPAGRIVSSPSARQLARQADIDLATVNGSGPNGRIIKSDVESAISKSASAASGTATQESGVGWLDKPHSAMRKAVAERLLESKQSIPHAYVTIDCKLDELLALRKELNASKASSEGAGKVSINDFVIRAVALALKEQPQANASWSETAMRIYQDIDISVAVATEHGLITPVVKQADKKELASISKEVKELVGRAQIGKLSPSEYQGGTFTVSNLGMYGVKNFNAIINPPQSCILAFGAAEPRAVVEEGEVKIATMVTCTFSFDHRVIDGAVCAQLAAAFKRCIENPELILS